MQPSEAWREAFMNLGWHFEDIAVGTGYQTAARTVTEADLVNFMGFSGIFENLYQDVEYALNESVFRGRVVPGLCTLSIAEGLMVQAGLFHGTGLALLQMQELEWPRPTFVGDTIRADVSCLDKRESRSKPDRGIVTFTHEVRNQRGETVLLGRAVRLVRRRVA
jgi:acyl dehydratase